MCLERLSGTHGKIHRLEGIIIPVNHWGCQVVSVRLTIFQQQISAITTPPHSPQFSLWSWNKIVAVQSQLYMLVIVHISLPLSQFLRNPIWQNVREGESGEGICLVTGLQINFRYLINLRPWLLTLGMALGAGGTVGRWGRTSGHTWWVPVDGEGPDEDLGRWLAQSSGCRPSSPPHQSRSLGELGGNEDWGGLGVFSARLDWREPESVGNWCRAANGSWRRENWIEIISVNYLMSYKLDWLESLSDRRRQLVAERQIHSSGRENWTETISVIF